MNYTLTSDGDTNVLIPQGATFSADVSGTFDSATLAVQRATTPAVAASLTTALTGDDNDLVFTAQKGGTDGNAITVAYVSDSARPYLSVSVDNGAIEVTLKLDTDGSTILTTAAEVKSAIEDFAPANAIVSVADAGGNDGTGVVTALAATALSSGTNGGFTTFASGDTGSFTAAGERVFENTGASDYINLNVSSAGGSTSIAVEVLDLGGK